MLGKSFQIEWKCKSRPIQDWRVLYTYKILVSKKNVWIEKTSQEFFDCQKENVNKYFISLSNYCHGLWVKELYGFRHLEPIL